MHTTRTSLVAAAALACLASGLLAGCADDQDRDGVVTATVQFGIRYTVGPDTYDDERARADLDKCLALPGATSAGQEDSLPPQRSVRSEGSPEDQDVLERCLKKLPDAVVSEPRPVPSGF